MSNPTTPANAEEVSAYNNRVFGCAIVKSITSNYNADFSHQPRTLPDGTVFATDKAFKYTIRNFWNDFYTSDKVLFYKSVDAKLQPRTLDERYLDLFNQFNETNTSTKFCVFEFDGENVIGMIPDKINSPKLKKHLKDNAEGAELKENERQFEKIAREGKETELKDAKKNGDPDLDESYFFYFDKAGKEVIISGETDVLRGVIEGIATAMGGGVDRSLHLKDLLTCIDVRVFGATYAGKKTNVSVHGTCQISHGKNKWGENAKFTSQIMSPFRNPGDGNKDSTMTTLGTQTDLQEGHYVHHFSVNPKNIEANGLTTADIPKLKEGMCKGATYLDSSRKIGVENELMLWIELKEDSKIVLPSFVDMVIVGENLDEKGNVINLNRVIDLDNIAKLLAFTNLASQVQSIELYYNQLNLVVKNKPANTTEYNIVTMEKVTGSAE
jgi:CRISPR/Cas system type I-B associated protein Csh2 (Cas7 group RAMP superfamily)